jgi:hypothetical protein
MKKTLTLMAIGLSVIGCKKEIDTVKAPAPPPAVQNGTAAAPEPKEQAQTPAAPKVDPLVQEERTYRDAAEQILSDWRGGTKPTGFRPLTSDFVDRQVLLDFKIVSFKRKEWSQGGNKGLRYDGMVNLQLQSENGTPATRQYRIMIQKEAGAWALDLLDR